MKTCIVKCHLQTNCFKRGKDAVFQRTLRFLKTGSDKGSYDFVQEDIKDCPESFFENIDNFQDGLADGYYDLEVRWFSGTYEYPNEGYVEYTLKKDADEGK